jgi:hypothetical protein
MDKYFLILFFSNTLLFSQQIQELPLEQSGGVLQILLPYQIGYTEESVFTEETTLSIKIQEMIIIWTKSNSNNERKYVWNDLRVPDSYIINEIPDYSYTSHNRHVTPGSCLRGN